MADSNFVPAPDLTSHAQLPLGEIVNAIVSKPEKEQQMALRRNEDIRQSIDTALSAVTMGQNLVKNSIEINAARQAQRASSELAKVMGEPAATAPVAPPIQQYDASGSPSRVVTPTYGQTQAGASKPSRMLAAATGVDPKKMAGEIAESNFNPNKGTMGGLVPVINQKTGERAFVQADKAGNRILSNGQLFTADWIRDYAPTVIPNQLGVNTIYDKVGPNAGTNASTPNGGDNSRGIPALQMEAPRLAERFVEARDKAFPQNNKALEEQVTAASSAAGIKTILSAKGEINGVALNSLGFYFARSAGSNSQLSDAEREIFQEPLGLIDRVVNKGYKLGPGDLSPKMRKNLAGLADLYERKAKAQGNRLILSAKRNAAAQVGTARFQRLKLGEEFPSMDELAASMEDMAEPGGGGLNVDMSAIDAELAKRQGQQ